MSGPDLAVAVLGAIGFVVSLYAIYHAGRIVELNRKMSDIELEIARALVAAKHAAE
jgi:hypothetical protein